MRQPSFKIVLPADLRASLEAQAERAGLSLAELMRRKLSDNLPEDSGHLQALRAMVTVLAGLVEISTGHRYDEHPAATETLRQAISNALERLGARTGAKFVEADLAGGERLVPSIDPVAIGAALEMIATEGIVSRHEERDAPRLYQVLAGYRAAMTKFHDEIESDGDVQGDGEGEAKHPRRRLRKSERK